MLDFQPFTQGSAAELAPLFEAGGNRACDYSFGTAYQWRGYYNSGYCIKDGMVFMYGAYEDDFGPCYMMPVGSGDTAAALRLIEADAKEKGLPLKLYVPGEKSLETVKALYGERVTEIRPVRYLFDYLYDINDLKTFAGKKMHTQRNHLNRFLRDNPEAEFVPVTAETLPEAEAFLKEYEQEKNFASEMERDEVESSLELLRLSPETGLPAGFIRTFHGIAALAVGEVVRDTLFVHAEKARTSFSGAYQAIVALFAQYAAGAGVLYCNREDDSGDPGLRASKQSYQPIGFIEKYTVLIDGGQEQ